MKSRFLMCFTAITLFALAVPVQLTAQDKRDHSNHNKHHHYQFTDLGTFGGPTSRNDGIWPAMNNRGTVIGTADTSTPDPFYPNDPLIQYPGPPTLLTIRYPAQAMAVFAAWSAAL